MKKTILSISFLLIWGFGKSQNITFKSDTLYPEGIAYNPKQDVFFVSSLRYGKIGTVNRRGEYKVFVDSPEMISAIGIQYHEKSNTLFVCTSDLGVSKKTSTNTQRKFAKLIAYDATTGKQKFIADLGALNLNGMNFANDVAIDNDGNAYVTNSFSPIIYKVDQMGKASIFVTSERWRAEGFGLNGIVFHPRGFLIVAQSNPGKLFKVLIANPENISEINCELLPGTDGMIYDENENDLVAISNAKQEIYKIESSDNWSTASKSATVKSVDSFPTTGTIVGKSYFVLNAKLNELFNPTAPKSSHFTIQEVKF